MVKIRLTRLGRLKKPCYRVIVTDSRSPRDGRFLDKIGNYFPLLSSSEERICINKTKLIFWLKHGAQPSERVLRIIKTINIDKPKFLVKRINKILPN